MRRLQKFGLLLLLLFSLSALAQESPQLGELSQKVKEELVQVHELADRGKIDDAIVKMQALIKTAPQDSYQMRLQYDLANLLFLQGRYREARAAYQRVLMITEDQTQMVAHARERINKMKEREAKKKDEVAIRLIDIETALDTDQMPPPGTKEFLKKAMLVPDSPHQETAAQLLQRIAELENDKARELLNTARRVFDVERNYAQVVMILETIEREFPETLEMPSVRILMAETERRLGRKTSSSGIR